MRRSGIRYVSCGALLLTWYPGPSVTAIFAVTPEFRFATTFWGGATVKMALLCPNKHGRKSSNTGRFEEFLYVIFKVTFAR